MNNIFAYSFFSLWTPPPSPTTHPQQKPAIRLSEFHLRSRPFPFPVGPHHVALLSQHGAGGRGEGVAVAGQLYIFRG